MIEAPFPMSLLLILDLYLWRHLQHFRPIQNSLGILCECVGILLNSHETVAAKMKIWAKDTDFEMDE